MSTTKRISGVYTIQTLNPTDQINIDSPTVIINGNLYVTGNSQTTSSVDSAITNNQIVLNSGWTGTPILNANITVDRGASANASIGWNESLHVWQASNGTTVSNIALSVSTISNVYADSAPAISANLDLRGHAIWDSTSTANAQLYISTIGPGGTGLHVTNNNYSNVEIISKTRSVAYSILFG
jgi:hypothetical protein